MSRFLYVSLAKNSFLISDGERSFKRMEINNFEDCVPILTHIDVYNKETNQTENIIKSENLEKSNYKNIPFVPLIQSVYNNLKVNIQNFQSLVKEEFSISRLFKQNIIVAIPDDSTEVDKKCAIDFFHMCCFVKEKGVYLVHVGLVLAVTEKEGHCCTLTKSNRAVTLSLILHGGFIKQVFFPEKYSDLAEIQILINSWRNQFNFSKLPVFIYGEDTELFSSLGTVVTNNVLFDNMIFVAKNIRK